MTYCGGETPTRLLIWDGDSKVPMWPNTQILWMCEVMKLQWAAAGCQKKFEIGFTTMMDSTQIWEEG